MLYKPSAVESKQIDFLFNAKPYNEDIDLKEVAAIEGFYKKNGYIPENYIGKFLNWVTYAARTNCSQKLDYIPNSSFAGQCAVAQDFNKQLFKKFGMQTMLFNVGDVLGTENIHALTAVYIPTQVDGKDVAKCFLLDPTFRQFCITEENRFERYDEAPRWAVVMSTPHPGYFFNLTDKGREFASDLITYGYFEATDSNIKTYFDPFALYVTPKEAYENSGDVGKISRTSTPGSQYFRMMVETHNDWTIGRNNFDLTTPGEHFDRERRKVINRIKSKLGRSELDEMFEIVDGSTQPINLNTRN